MEETDPLKGEIADSAPIDIVTEDDSDLTILKKISKMALSTLGFICVVLLDTICFILLGMLNDSLLLSSLGFGSTVVIAFGTGVCYGFASGFGIIASHAFGAKNYREIGFLVHKTTLVMVFIVLFYAGISFLIEWLLLALEFHPDLAANIGYFCKWSIPHVCSFAIFQVLWFYLNTLGIAKDIYALYLSSLIINALIGYYLIVKLELGLSGVGITKALTLTFENLVLYIVIKTYNEYPQTWIEWSKESLEGIMAYFKTLLIHSTSLYFEWIYYELTSLNVAMLKDLPILAGHSLAVNFIYLIFNPPLAITISASTLVAEATGEGSADKVKRLINVSIKMILGFGGTIIILIVVFHDNITRLYTQDEEIIKIGGEILLIYCIGYYGDTMTNYLGFILRALGNEDFVATWYIISYFLVGLPLSVVLCHVVGLSYKGVWIGIITGALLNSLVNARKLYKIDLEAEVSEISKNHKLEKQDRL